MKILFNFLGLLRFTRNDENNKICNPNTENPEE